MIKEIAAFKKFDIQTSKNMGNLMNKPIKSQNNKSNIVLNTSRIEALKKQQHVQDSSSKSDGSTHLRKESVNEFGADETKKYGMITARDSLTQIA